MKTEGEAMIPEDEFEGRLTRIREKMEKKTIHGLFMAGDEFHQANIRYVSDYTSVLEFAGVIIPLEAEPVLLVGPECETLARQKSKIRNIYVCSDLVIPGEEYPHAETLSLKEILVELDTGREIKKWGLVNPATIPKFIMDSLREIRSLQTSVDASDVFTTLRAMKSRNEIALIQKAYLTAARGMEVAIAKAGPGVKECDLAAEIVYEMYRAEPEQLSHVLQVSSGLATSSALGRPSNRKTENGDPLIVDIGAVHGGYYSDCGRTFVIGKENRKIIEARKIANRAFEVALERMRPGIPGYEIDRAARKVVNDAGYSKHQIYGVAHSVGLEHCEEPMCTPSDNGLRLAEGMVFAVDIGLFNLPFGGIRIEEGVLITEHGAEVLTPITRLP